MHSVLRSGMRSWVTGWARIAVLLTAIPCCQESVSLGAWNTLSSARMDASLPSAVAPAADAEAAAGTEAAVSAANVASVDADVAASTDADAATALDAEVADPVDAGIPACLAQQRPGILSAEGLMLLGTETTTDWTLPAPVQSMSWTLTIERQVSPVSEGQQPTSGYYWHNQFSFVPGVAGRLGVQDNGLYQSDPPDSPRQFTKMAVFWLSGPPLAGELGDIAYPDARVAAANAAGASWLTIHARFDWHVCHVYRFTVGPQATEPDGNVWYGAWIEDTTTGEQTFLGRMLLPADSGALSPFSSSRTSPIDFNVASCSLIEPVSALFGAPVGDEDQANVADSRFSTFLGCARSRLVDFSLAVRHELGLAP